uniref:Patatin-like phospholipase n=1 Tax=Megaviridae environmental sample TaxID=1737588 RepID=A0A5J6VHM0_9VIRU|nr:MAG: patatin-like phospholipase [Megaviridae environmental sample]
MIDSLILSGGALKGILMLGVIHGFIEEGIIDLKTIKNYYGVSVGAMISIMLMVGYTPNELFTEITKLDLTKLDNIKDLVDFIEDFGLDDGENVMMMIRKLLQKKLSDDLDKITFKDLSKFGNLCIQATNISKYKLVSFSTSDTPNMGVLLALRMSIGVPVMFKPIKFEGDLYVDGCVISNAPITKDTPNKLAISTCLLKIEELYNQDVFSYLIRVIRCAYASGKINYTNQVTISFIPEEPLIDYNITLNQMKSMWERGIKLALEYIDSKTLDQLDEYRGLTPNQVISTHLDTMIDKISLY